MAKTPLAGRLTESHRQTQARGAAITARQVASADGLLSIDRLSDTFERWLDLVTPIIVERNVASSLIAQRYLERFYTAEGAPPPSVAVADPIRDGHVRRAMTSNLLAVTRKQLRVRTPDDALRAGVSQAVRESSRLTLLGGRKTIGETVASDDRAAGWTRVTSGSPCPFCTILASRGPAYKEESAGDFQAHKGCNCTVEPVLDQGGYKWPPSAVAAREQYERAVVAAERDGVTLETALRNNGGPSRKRPTPASSGPRKNAPDARRDLKAELDALKASNAKALKKLETTRADVDRLRGELTDAQLLKLAREGKLWTWKAPNP